MNNELDREALLIYLNDLRTMETIILEDNKKLKLIDEKTHSYELEYKKANYEMIYQVGSRPTPPTRDSYFNSITSEESAKDKLKKRYIIIWLVLIAISIGAMFLLLGFNHGYISTYISLFIVFCVGWGLYIFCKYKDGVEAVRMSIAEERKKCERKWKEGQERYNETYEKYKTKERKISAALTTLNNFKDGTEKCISEINIEKEDIAEKLQEAYNANIIPIQFRNIEGIYYLYDYISTSNQGLSEALMQCNLEAIKQQLYRVINMQGEMIVRQAQHNAAMYEQNQQLLNMARATVVNTAMAAKYAKISSINSDVALRLQSQDLAYQKADFWLK